MRNLIYFLSPILLVLTACSEDNNEAPDPMPGQVTALIDGAEFRSDLTTTTGQFSTLLNSRTMEVDAPAGSSSAPGLLVLGMIDNIGGTGDCVPVGTYGQNALGQQFSTMAYIVGTTTYTTLGQDVSLSITVTECDETNQTVSGEFSATLQIGIDSTTLEVTGGRFNQVPFTK